MNDSGNAGSGIERMVLGVWGRFFFVGLFLAASGCGADEVEDDGATSVDSGFSQEDSSGVLISVSDGTEAREPIGWVVDTIPELILGDEDAPDEQFLRIAGLRGLPGGGVLVVDGISRELRFFDATGRLSHRVGRKGEGPGEFDTPDLVPTLGTDSLLLWDRGLARFQKFSGDGQAHRTIRLTNRMPGGRSPPVGAVDHLMLVRRPELFTAERFSRAGPISVEVDFLWLDPLTGAETVLRAFTETIGYVAVARGSSGPESIPFNWQAMGTVSETAALISEGRTSEISEYGLDGDLRRIFRLAGPGRPVTEEIVEGALDLATSDGRSRELWERIFSQIPIPDTLPWFNSLQVDEEGWLWAEVYEWKPAQPVEWILFDPAGRARGSIKTPPGLEVHRIGEDFVLGVWKDDLDVEYVKRYRLRRTLPGR